MKDKPPTEREIRKLRDRVYGHATSDKNWAGCRENWMKPEAVEWLKRETKTP